MAPPGVAIIGLGGFAGQHHRSVRALEAAGVCRLIATCDPNPGAFAEQAAELGFAERGVRVYDDYRAMLAACAGEVVLATVPTPVPLHAEMHRACVDLGIACYLEKPPTLWDVELEEMIATDARARRATQVGFNFIIEAPRRALKERIVRGGLGAVQRVTFLGMWPRGERYFLRNNWAARLMMAGRPVLDSVIGNAMAHYVHNVLFWCGAGAVDTWGDPASVEAELYRAHDIGTFDTAFLRAQIAGGPEVRIAATHACAPPAWHREEVRCERAAIEYVTGARVEVHHADGAVETLEPDTRDLLAENLAATIAYAEGRADRPVTRLEDCRPFVRLNDLAFIAAGHVAAVDVGTATPRDAGADRLLAIDGLEDAVRRFGATGELPSEQGVPWGRPGGAAQAADTGRLLSVLHAMAR